MSRTEAAVSEISESISYGVTASASNQPDGHKMLRITDIQNDAVNWTSVPWCSSGTKGIKNAELMSGDIVFARTGATTGKSFLIKDCPDGAVFASYLIRVRPNGSLVEPAYLAQFFRSGRYWSQIQAKANGVAQPGVNATSLGSLRVPMLPMDEQRRIAGILDAADALQAKRRQTHTKGNELVEAIFTEMFLNRANNWKQLSIDELASSQKNAIRTGPFGSQLLHGEFTDSGIPVLGIDNAVHNRFTWAKPRFITEQKYKQLRRYTVHPGDVLVTIMATCGRVAIAPDDIPTAINTKHLCCITPNFELIDSQFLWACLRFHPEVLRHLGATRGAVMPGLNMSLIKSARIPVPPLKLQKRFAKRKAAVDALCCHTEASAKGIERCVTSLQQKAFRGEL